MGVRLPSAYQEVEWIGTTGTQIIDTDYLPVDGDEMSIEFSFTSFPGSKNFYCLAATDNSDPQVQFVFGNYSASRTLFYKYFSTGEAKRLKTSFAVNTIYRIDVASNGDCTCNGVTVSPANNLGYATGHMRFFARMAGNINFIGRLYKFVASHSGVEKVNLVPCYRKSDSEAGLYDLISDVFYTNTGTGEFEVGPDVIDSISPLMVAWRREMMQNVKSARLPREYQEVEYIEGTGTQYININSTDQSYEMECECLFPRSRTNGAMFWGGSSFSDSDAWALFQSSSGLTLRRRKNGNSDCSLNNNVYINKKIHAELFESHCRFSDEDGEVLAEIVAKKQNQYPTYMWLFHGCSNGGYSTRYVSARLYWMKVYINGTLVYHLIPCYRKEDGEIGVYDLINNRFNANNGTGVFLKGKNV